MNACSCLPILLLIALTTTGIVTRAESPAHQYAIAFWSDEKKISDSSGISQLLRALKRNGYQGVLMHGQRISETRISEQSARAVMNALRHKPSSNARWIGYYQGTVQLQEGHAWLGDGKKTSLAPIIRRIAKSAPDDLDIFLVLDIESSDSCFEIKTAIGRLIRQFHAPISVLVCHRGERPVGPSLIPKWWCRALNYDIRADKNQDGSVSISELANYLRTHLLDTTQVAWIPSNDEVESMEVSCFHEKNLEELIEDLADQLAVTSKEQAVECLVIPDFKTIHPNTESQRSSMKIGFLSSYLTRRITELLKKTLDSVHVVTPSQWNQEIGPHPNPTLDGVIRDLVGEPKSFLNTSEKTALISGNIRLHTEFEKPFLFSSCKVLLVQNGHQLKTISLPKLQATLASSEAGMAGQTNMSRRSVLESGIRWSAGGSIDPLHHAPHPMSDSNFPLKVYLEARDGKRFNHRFSSDDQQMFVDLHRNDEYTIVIKNETKKDLFLRLLVDGKNTLPDHWTDRAGTLKPAQHVSLVHARSWFCKAEGTYRVSGYYMEIGRSQDSKNAIWKTFQVTDAQNDWVPDEYREQLGVITAAFYIPTDKHKSSMAAYPKYATQMGIKQMGLVPIYQGNHAPGELLGNAPINIRYGFSSKGNTEHEENNDPSSDSPAIPQSRESPADTRSPRI